MTFKVGDKLFFVRDRSEPFEIDILKVGNKFLTVRNSQYEHSREFRIIKENLREDTNFGYSGRAYLVKEHWELEVQSRKLFDELRMKIGYSTKASPDAIKEAGRLLGIKLESV